MNSVSMHAMNEAIRSDGRPFDRHTTRHPRLTIAAVLALGICADWIADGAATLILRVIG